MSRLHRNRKKMALKKEHSEQCLKNYMNAVNREFSYMIKWKEQIGDEYDNMTEDERIKSFAEFRKNYILDENK